jgi:hypothetical protein
MVRSADAGAGPDEDADLQERVPAIRRCVKVSRVGFVFFS